MTELLDWSREKDPQAREQRRAAAYADVFGSELGRLVLIDQLVEAGAFDPVGSPTAERPGLLEYAAGRRDHAMELAALAGVDRTRQALALIERNEGYDDRHNFDD